jgi:hypothetical protein
MGASEEDGKMTIEEFAAEALAQQKAVIRARYSDWQADAEQVQVIPGRVYTKIDFGTKAGGFSGRYMVENATGVIYGIKGYGKVHKGHRYGTLATVDDWFWGEYYPRPRPADD